MTYTFGRHLPRNGRGRLFSMALLVTTGLVHPATAQSGPAIPPVPAVRPLRAIPYTPSLDLASMDKTVDPCVDFYQYVCGGWQIGRAHV